MRILILANGLIADPDLLRRRIAAWEPQQIFAADGGTRHALTLGLLPQRVIGDLDSMDEALRALLPGAAFSAYPAEKDETDLELALMAACDADAAHIVIVGALGGRLDMTLANLLLLAHPCLAERRVEVWEGAQTAWLIQPPGEVITGEPGDTLSLLPLAGDAGAVRTTGLAYPLHGETLHFGPARGISNVFSEQRAQVSLTAGLLLAVHTPGRA